MLPQVDKQKGPHSIVIIGTIQENAILNLKMAGPVCSNTKQLPDANMMANVTSIFACSHIAQPSPQEPDAVGAPPTMDESISSNVRGGSSKKQGKLHLPIKSTKRGVVRGAKKRQKLS